MYTVQLYYTLDTTSKYYTEGNTFHQVEMWNILYQMETWNIFISFRHSMEAIAITLSIIVSNPQKEKERWNIEQVVTTLKQHLGRGDGGGAGECYFCHETHWNAPWDWQVQYLVNLLQIGYFLQRRGWWWMFARSIVINTSRSASGLIARETWRTDGGTVSAGDFILTLSNVHQKQII